MKEDKKKGYFGKVDAGEVLENVRHLMMTQVRAGTMELRCSTLSRLSEN
ncbi:hypothetical protein [Niabella hibiscisoli]|nr:hypothetical protein [Niabella hibiscisoli]MCH5718680.1 hypothetical protein [Niabella hibiscisoli]